MKPIHIKRVYETPEKTDGYRILVDKIWPRGVSKEKAKLDDWNKAIAPTTALRKWFDHDPDKFKSFSETYKEELKNKTDDLKRICERAKHTTVTLVYSAKDPEHNQAVVLKQVLEEFEV